MPARMRRTTPFATPLRFLTLSLTLTLSLLLPLTACRTRPWDLEPGPDAQPPSDLSLPPDLSVPHDLTIIPDLTPPPDLVPPHYCDGIFVFDQNQKLSFFDPIKLSFTDLVTLNCPAQKMASPFSMGVGRDGIAYVEYTSGELFRVDTYTGKCSPSKFQPNQNGFSTFGMGFAANGPNSKDETLFIAGYGQTALGSIDLMSLTVSLISPLPSGAELTGTGAGELWGFFGTQSPFVARLDKATGDFAQMFSVGQVIGDASQSGYAFGFFGGVFYIFLVQPRQSTTVYRFDPNDGSVKPVLMNTGRHIVGAGVSTCAPTH